jgi:hypothetical protein
MRTIFLAPATEVLIEVKSSRAVSELDVCKPLRDDAQQGSIQADGGTNYSHDNPSLCGIIGL